MRNRVRQLLQPESLQHPIIGFFHP